MARITNLTVESLRYSVKSSVYFCAREQAFPKKRLSTQNQAQLAGEWLNGALHKPEMKCSSTAERLPALVFFARQCITTRHHRAKE
jgi:hypothetical protein